METRKSSRSMMLLPAPKGSTDFSRLQHRAQGIASTSMATQQMRQTFFLGHPVISITQETMHSKTVNTVDRAAKDMNRKNMLPQNRPRGRLLNTLGRVIKIKLGPLATSMS